jgi:micrococcal nuclease
MRGDPASLGWLMVAMFGVALAVLRAGTMDRDARAGGGASETDQLVSGTFTPAAATISSADTLRASFTLCHSGGGTNCVVDGDTFWFEGRTIRIADIDTPETHPARCAAEAARGNAATQRLYALLNAGPFSLTSIDRATDRYGRELRIVTRDGASVGGMLVGEGLARWYGGGIRDGWC